ncbi:MAG: hypothetical protein ABIK43_01535 [candidate division WOR-3 bacterium]
MNRHQLGLLMLLLTPAIGSQVRYLIKARLDETSRTIDCTQQIFIPNSTGETLKSLCFHLYPNAFRSNATRFAKDREAAGVFDFSLARPSERGSLSLHRLTSSRTLTHSDPTGDELEVILTPPLAPSDTVTLFFDYTVKLPFPFANLGARGRRYVVSDWYPQLALYDSNGWYADGYSSAGGSPSFPADYEVCLTVSSDLRIAATGSLTAPVEELEIMKNPGRQTQIGSCSTKTLIFHARDVPSFAWVAAPDFILTQDSAWDIKFNLFTRHRICGEWSEAIEYIRRITWNYTCWYGTLNSGSLTVVDGNGLLAQDMSFPGLVIIATRPSPYLRVLERSLAYGIAEQWFNVQPNPDPKTSPWLRSGLPAFSTLRHLEAEYSQDNLLNLPFRMPLLAGLSEEYLSGVIFSLAASAGLSRSPQAGPDEFRTEPFALEAFRRYQAALQLRSLQRVIGESELDRCIRTYLNRNRQRSTRLADFLAVLPDTIHPLLLADPSLTDYSISKTRRAGSKVSFEVNRSSASPLPVDIEIRYSDGTREALVWQRSDSACLRATIVPTKPDTKRRVSSATINSAHRLLELNRWNNTTPCAWEIKPLFALPSLDAYQFFYGPYIWFDNYHGMQLGLWAQGRRFLGVEPFAGAHTWTVSETYSTRISDWHSSVTYQTPLTFVSPRLRLKLAGDYSLVSAGARAGLELNFGRRFRLPRASLNLTFRVVELRDLRGRDTRAWEAVRLSEINLKSTHSDECRLLKKNSVLLIAIAAPCFGSTYRYCKLSTEHDQTLRLNRHTAFRLRLFAGTVLGRIPRQEQFYLSGALVPTDDEPLSFGYQGTSSSQEHWHYDGHVNCRGYAGSYRHGRWAYGINLYLLQIGPIVPFVDIGNVAATLDETGFWPPRADAGIRLKLGPLYLDLPFWKSHPFFPERHFSFRWLLGLKVSGLFEGS